MGIRVAAFATAALLAALVGGPVLAQAGKTKDEEAKERFFKGKTLVEEGLYEKAIVEFKESYKLKPVPVVLYNLSSCYELLHDYKEAVRYMKMYLKVKSKEVYGSEKEKLEDRIQKLEQFIGKIYVLVNEPEAIIRIDGQVAGVSAPIQIDGKDVGHGKSISSIQSVEAIGTVKIKLKDAFVELKEEDVGWDVNVGKHGIEVIKDGFKTWSGEVTVASGKTALVKVDLETEKTKKAPILKEKMESKKVAKETVASILESMMKPRLTITCAPVTAKIVVNGEVWGSYTHMSKEVEPGLYKVLIMAKGWKDWSRVVDIGPNDKLHLFVDMEPLEGETLPSEPEKKPGKAEKIKSKWWLWTTIGVLVGGALAGGIAAGVMQGGGTTHGTLDTRYPE